MTPKVYIDVEALQQSGDTGMSLPLLRGRMLAILHRLFSIKPHTYALAIPGSGGARQEKGGGILRVFASGRDDLDALALALAGEPWMRDYARLTPPQSVPADYAGPWVAFRRYRIPTLNSDRKTGDEHGQLRQRRMAFFEKEGMDYFIMHSATTKQRFTLVVNRQAGGPPESDCLPNSYGLCSEHNFFCVPDMP